MLKQPRKSSFSLFGFAKTSAKIVIALEVASLTVGYGIWHRLNTNQDFRLYVNANFPIVLQGFYKAAELLGTDTSIVRAADLKALQQAKPSTKS